MERAEREEKRLGDLDELIAAKRENAQLRPFLADLPRDQDAQQASDLTRMVARIRERIATLEQSLQSEHILAVLAQEKLFPEIDDLHDPLSEPLLGNW